MNGPEHDDPPLELISVIVPVFNGGSDFDRCLEAISASDWPNVELIVVDDASTQPESLAIARAHGARIKQLNQQSGPAIARNAGAEMARAEIIFFTDADVLLHPGTLRKAMIAFRSDPELAALFGSYDDTPGDQSLLSQYRNLYHHWNHQIGHERASTFWTGCGAIRRRIFIQLGGFSSAYEKPSIEDIELGYRLHEAGYRIRLVKDMLATHLKKWTFWDMVKTDVLRRGAPWVELLRRYESAPADLNLNWKARVATLFAGLFILTLPLLIVFGHAMATLPLIVMGVTSILSGQLAIRAGTPGLQSIGLTTVSVLIGLVFPLWLFLRVGDAWSAMPMIFVAVIVWAQWKFYHLLIKRRGLGFALAVIPLQIVFFLGCALSVPVGIAKSLRNRDTARAH